MTAYSVIAGDRYGELANREVPDFPSALVAYHELRAKYPGLLVLVFNDGRCDYNTSGLTEEEREALDEVRS